MADRAEFRRRVLVRLATGPWTIVPVVLGATILLAAWAIGTRSGVAPFAGVACIMGGLGAFATRLLLGSDAAATEVMEDMKHEADRQREKRLNDLDRRLCEDGDPRTEACLRDLRALTKAFRESRTPTASVGVRYAFDIAAGVQELFARCVRSLEQTLDLWQVAAKMVTPEAKKPVLDRREKVIEEVRKSTKQLGQLLAGLQTLGSAAGAEVDLARMREELDARLAVAKRVEERMRSLESQLGPVETESARTGE
jgi:hypothetical protein